MLIDIMQPTSRMYHNFIGLNFELNKEIKINLICCIDKSWNFINEKSFKECCVIVNRNWSKSQVRILLLYMQGIFITRIENN